MLKLLSGVTAAALLVGVSAFAQDAATPPPSTAAPSTAASADTSAPADSSGQGGEAKETRVHRHHRMARNESGSSTDHDADKLNACMANATPTEPQEQCLKHAGS